MSDEISRKVLTIRDSFKNGDYKYATNLILTYKNHIDPILMKEIIAPHRKEIYSVFQTWIQIGAVNLSTSIYAIMYDLDFDTRKFENLIKRNKDTIIRSILLDMKENCPRTALSKCNRLKSLNWPEVSIITKSAEKVIAENPPLFESKNNKQVLDQFRDFLIFCKKRLGLKKLPKIHWNTNDDVGQSRPSFGSFENETQEIRIGIKNRHPLDVMRTLAHELTHYKQFLKGELKPNSGETGSPQENEANSVAGIIMRDWNAAHESMFKQEEINEATTIFEAVTRRNVNRASEQEQIAYLERDPYRIQYIDDPSEAVQLAAVKLNGTAIRFIENPSEVVQLAAVQQTGYAIGYIRNPTREVQIAAVQQNGDAIQFIKTPSKAVQLAAVRQHGSAIQFIENPSKQVQLTAVEEAKDRIISQYNISDKDSALVKLLTCIKSIFFKSHIILYYVLRHTYPNWPEWAAIDRSLRKDKLINESIDLNSASEEEQISAALLEHRRVSARRIALSTDLDKVDEKKLVAIVRRHWETIKNVDNPSEAVQLAAVKQNAYAIKHIKNPTETVQIAAVKNFGQFIRYIKKPTEAVQLAAVKQSGSAIGWIKNPSEAVQLAAVRNYPISINYIKNPSKKVIGLAVKKERNEFFARHKFASRRDAVRTLLNYMISGHIYQDILIYYLFRYEYPDWPEWAAIDKSLSASKLINESNLINEAVTRRNVNRASEQEQIAYLERDPYRIQYIDDPSEAVQLAAVKLNGLTLEYIKWPSKAVQLAAVRQRGWAIRHIENPSEAVQLAAVNKNGLAIQYIKTPSEAVQLAAVRESGWVIQYIENPSEAIQLAAVKQNGRAIQFIKNPSEAVQLAAVQQNGLLIRFIKDPIDFVQIAAVKQNGPAIEFIENPSEAVQLAAVNQDGYLIQYIKQPSEAIQLAAVRQNGYAIYHIETPSEAVQLAAVRQYGGALKYIKTPSKTVILTGLLKMLKDLRNYGLILLYYRKFKKKYPDWLEWAAIEKSLRASGLI